MTLCFRLRSFLKLPLAARSAVTFLAMQAFVAFGCVSDDPVNYEGILGKWTITRVTRDGVIQPGWEGIRLTLEYPRLDQGKYFMPYTKDEKIWRSGGWWAYSIHQSEIFVDQFEVITVQYD